MKYTDFSKGSLIILSNDGFPINLSVQLTYFENEIRLKLSKGINLDVNQYCKLQVRLVNHEQLFFRIITLEGEIQKIHNTDDLKFIIQKENQEVIDCRNDLVPQLISTLPEGKQPVQGFNKNLLGEILNQHNLGLLIVTTANNIHAHRVPCNPNLGNLIFEIESANKLSSILQYITKGTIVFDYMETSLGKISINGSIKIKKKSEKNEIYNFKPQSMTYGDQSNIESMQITSPKIFSFTTLFRNLFIKTKYWYNLLRFPLILFSLIPLFIGSVLADSHSRNIEINLLIFEIITLIFFQSAANLLNDYFDHQSDSDDYAIMYTKLNAGSRFLQLGLISQEQVKNYSFFSLIFAITLGLWINSLIGGIDILIIGAIGALLILFYSLPPFKLSYRWYGDILFTFTIFPLILLGSSFAQAQHYSNLHLIILIGVSMASFVTAILFIGNIMSYDAEKAALKTTFTVKFGKQLTLSIIILFLLVHYVIELILFISITEFIILIPIIASAAFSIYSIKLLRVKIDDINILERSYKFLVYAFLFNYIPIVFLLYF